MKKQTILSIKVELQNAGKKPAVACQQFPLPSLLKDEELSPLTDKIIRAAALAAGVKLPKLKVY
jgi:hypothetical protein